MFIIYASLFAVVAFFVMTIAEVIADDRRYNAQEAARLREKRAMCEAQDAIIEDSRRFYLSESQRYFDAELRAMLRDEDDDIVEREHYSDHE